MVPGPPKAIGKGRFASGFTATLLTERFTAGRSMNSLVVDLRRHGAEISPATLADAPGVAPRCGKDGDSADPSKFVQSGTFAAGPHPQIKVHAAGCGGYLRSLVEVVRPRKVRFCLAGPGEPVQRLA